TFRRELLSATRVQLSLVIVHLRFVAVPRRNFKPELWIQTQRFTQHENPVHRFDLRADHSVVSTLVPVENIKRRRSSVPRERLRIDPALGVKRIVHPSRPAGKMRRTKCVITNKSNAPLPRSSLKPFAHPGLK